MLSGTRSLMGPGTTPASSYGRPLAVAGETWPQSGMTFGSDDLLRARVIRQIDHKFICCTVPSPPDTPTRDVTLVLVDQHAADERISVEAILRELCAGFRADSVPITELPEPRPLILINREEAQAFASPDAKAVIRRWGVDVELVSPAGSTAERPDFAQVRVHGVPTMLQSRLGRMQASEMTRLISLFLQDAENVVPAAQSYLTGIGKEDRGEWTRVLGYMPKEMLELANSKACRSE